MQNMNPQAYLNVSVDHLFEQHTISEIESVHTKLQNEIDQKRQEIRKFVGERYRDLIQAADSITDMKDTSASIISHVDKIQTSCKKLNDQQLIGFRNEPDLAVKQIRLKKARFYGVVLQIKLLTSIPELIWKYLEGEDFFVATQLYAFSRHITTGLQLETNSDVVQHFPVLKMIWDTLTPFYAVIKEKCILTLEREVLSPEIAAKCLASILLLEGCDFKKLLSIFIQGRSKAYAEILDSENPKYEKAREKIMVSLSILIQTVELMHTCFIDAEGTAEGLLFRELRILASDGAPYTIELIQNKHDFKMTLLPDIVVKFRPQVNIPTIKPEDLQQINNNWLRYVQDMSSSHLSSLVLLITSIKTIQDVKRKTSSVPKPKNWSSICSGLQLPDDLDFYSKFYQELIDSRLQQIIQSAWRNALDETLNDLKVMLDQNSKANTNLKTWLWKEESNDCPNSLKEALEARKDQRKLLMKASGFTPEIVEICMSFDKKLEALFNDIKMYLNGENDMSFKKRAETNVCDQIGAFLNECSRENVARLITQIKGIQIEERSENYILLARFLQAIPILCFNLKSCLLSSTLAINWDEASANSELYTKTCLLLNEESINFWMLWLDIFIQKLENQLKNSNKRIDLNSIMKEFPNWETITIDEKDELDNTIESTIRVPSKPSFPLQRFLHDTCTLLNDIIPHTLPKKISTALLQKLAAILKQHYQSLASIDFVCNNQNAALQYYFDLKFIHLILVARDNKILIEGYNAVIVEFKNFIDPFDFDVLYPYVNDNVKVAAQRMQYQLGCLISNSDQTLISSVTSTVTSKQERDPNVLPLSANATTITWFPLLPISDQSLDSSAQSGLAMSASAGKLAALVENEKTMTSSKSSTSLDKTLRTAQNYADNVKSGAAAFFGDWFKS